MPIRRFRSVEDMSRDEPLPPLDPGNLRQAFDLMELTERLHPIKREPGVRKFRDVAEASSHRASEERKQIRARPRSVRRASQD